MTSYLEIARALEAASGEGRRVQKVEVIGSLLKRAPPEILRPVVRLVSGELWPPWEPREMGVGPEILGGVLRELSGQGGASEAAPSELGDLAETVVVNRSQQTLNSSEMEAVRVYEALRQISAQKGAGAVFRKRSLLMGLFLNSSPLEAKYIARTVLGSTIVGLGPSLISAAIGKAFSVDEHLVRRAYARLPDLGMVALHAFNGDIFEVKLAPPNPPLFMPFRRVGGPEAAVERAGTAACVFRYGGLRVQIHKLNDRIFIYTRQLRNVTPSLADLADEMTGARGNMILEGEFLLIRDGKVLPRPEMVGRINLKGRSRGSEEPLFAASDLLFIDGMSVIDEGYAKRRRLLNRALQGVAGPPLHGKVFLAEERVVKDREGAMDMLRSSLDKGYAGLFIRDLDGAYTPGRVSRENVAVSPSLPS
ncbi:MAG: DNA_LIGASE_A3 domain-containing protein [Methanothrix sp.]|jgi:DNA ligase-1|nr:MAG: DNA_LIGASE_A3 domain-containing protein [Methanothrix sp.]